MKELKENNNLNVLTEFHPSTSPIWQPNVELWKQKFGKFMQIIFNLHLAIKRIKSLQSVFQSKVSKKRLLKLLLNVTFTCGNS